MVTVAKGLRKYFGGATPVPGLFTEGTIASTAGSVIRDSFQLLARSYRDHLNSQSHYTKALPVGMGTHQ
jgi:hypothetical protein